MHVQPHLKTADRFSKVFVMFGYSRVTVSLDGLMQELHGERLFDN